MSVNENQLQDAHAALNAGDAAHAMALCDTVITGKAGRALYMALLLKARARLAENLIDEARAAASMAAAILPDELEAWDLLNESLERIYNWQIKLQHETVAVNQTLQDMTLARVEIANRMLGKNSRQTVRKAPAKGENFLEELAIKYRPSKRGHDYIRHFWRHFGERRLEVKKFVEIGLADQPQEKRPDSLMMWEEFFPNAEIWGVDINPECRRFEGGRRKILIGDQKNHDFLRSIITATGGEIDIIVDDGEHTPHAILTSFTWLFGALSDHGVYVIEDIAHQRRVQQFLLDLADGVNHWPIAVPHSDWPYLSSFKESVHWIRKNITGVAFYRFLCFVTRGFNPEDNPYLRVKPLPIK